MAAVAMVYNPQSKHEKKRPRATCEMRFLAGLYELDPLGLLLRRQGAWLGPDRDPKEGLEAVAKAPTAAPAWVSS